MTAPSAEKLHQACDTLAEQDPVLATAYRAIGLPNWRGTTANFESLARIVVYQLISTKAADAIWARVHARFAQITAKAVLDDEAEQLRACGLSRPKLQHLLAIAAAVEAGDLDFNRLSQSPIDGARKTLLAVRGIGPWTAETFLMNAIGHLDAFPHGDVGLIEAFRRLSGAENRLSAKDFSAHAEQWRPFRAVAAHLLYDWYNANRP